MNRSTMGWAKTGVLAIMLWAPCAMAAESTWAQRTPTERAGYTALAVVGNIVPIVSAFWAPRCLQGYILCKVSFASISVIAAAESLVMSGGSDSEQPLAILKRGFSGDWVLTGEHTARDADAQPYPDAPPPVDQGGTGFTPPPI